VSRKMRRYATLGGTRRRRVRPGVVASLVLVVRAAFGCQESEEGSLPNVPLITIDVLRREAKHRLKGKDPEDLASVPLVPDEPAPAEGWVEGILLAEDLAMEIRKYL
ncbi:hypothetical protein MK280_11360, partial [Myxococcota bacterium]|nr:hypothetical protein [Myxococcota bacterium]